MPEGGIIHFLDFEASRLPPGGFPIEIGWATVQANGVFLGSGGTLIRPIDVWLDDLETNWDGNAQAVHGIALRDLMAHGRPVTEVAEHALAALAGGRVVCSYPAYDGPWFEQLLSAAGVRRERWPPVNDMGEVSQGEREWRVHLRGL